MTNSKKGGKKSTGNESSARLSIFGLGYVGAVSAACFADCGHHVLGVDPDHNKRDIINSGSAPIVEPGLDELIRRNVDAKRLLVIDDVPLAVRDTDISFICVGTPSASDGSCDLSHLYDVSKQIGQALREKSAYHVVVFRSTIPPGTTRQKLLHLIEQQSGKICGIDFGLCFHPEFLRESTAIVDFFEPPKTVIGTFDVRSGEALGRLYEELKLEVIHTSLEAAEMVKYVDNSWHALKVSFANEIGRLARAAGVDSHEVMGIFSQDTKLNISSYYLRPGSAFGGSCLPKDLRGLGHLAHQLKVEIPVLSSIIPSNEAQIAHTISLIKKTGSKSIGFLGVTFKKDTDDLRESPVLHVMAALHAQGYQIRFFDRNLDLGQALAHHKAHSKGSDDAMCRLIGKFPAMACASSQEVCEFAETIVVSHDDPGFRRKARHRRSGQHVVDLVRLFHGELLQGKIEEAGMNDYLQKPVNGNVLSLALEKWTRKSSAPRILLAEDDGPTRLVTQKILEKSGCQVDVVTNGSEAITAAANTNYDLIFLDIFMPVKNGLAAAKEIRTLPGQSKSAPIVALSSYASPENNATYSGICW